MWNPFKHKHRWERNVLWTRDYGHLAIWDRCDCQKMEISYVKRSGRGALTREQENDYFLIFKAFGYKIRYVGAMEGKDYDNR